MKCIFELFSLKYVRFLLLFFSLSHGLFKFYCLIFRHWVFFLFLLLISSLIPGWSEKIFWMISVFWNCWDFLYYNILILINVHENLLYLYWLIFNFWFVLPAIEKDMLMTPTVIADLYIFSFCSVQFLFSVFWSNAIGYT